jgi:hypothetical protein
MVLRLLPVYRKVLPVEARRFSKPATDSLIAAYRLVVLIARSRAKSEREGARGSAGEVGSAAAAVGRGESVSAKKKCQE